MPDAQQRAELLRIAELYTGGAASAASTAPPAATTPLQLSSRESSQERGVSANDKLAQKQRQYPCATCGKIFTSASNRNMHQRIHKGVRPFRCVPCGVFFRQKAHLQKHQKTQGHVQATDIYEKKRRDGLLPAASNNNNNNNNGTTTAAPAEHDEEQESVKSEDTSSSYEHQNLLVDSTSTLLLAAQHIDSSSADEKCSSTTRARSKSSPKRKQARPQYVAADSREADCGEEDRLRAFVEYNDVTHGYECRQCTFASHELAAIKDHARDEHLGDAAAFRCQECHMGFAREFHLRVHQRKHEEGGSILPCDLCSLVYKSPNKVLQHLEVIHSVCPTCGERCGDPAGLAQHSNEVHADELRKGFLAQLNLKAIAPPPPPPPIPAPNSNAFGPMTALNILAQTAENRAAKMRKVDSLAETIRQRQEQQAHGEDPLRAKKGLHLQPNEHLLRKSENNNILSNLKLLPPAAIRLPTQPVAGLTPPSSPPPTPSQHCSGQCHHCTPTTLLPLEGHDSDSEMDEDDSPAGLDLSMKHPAPSSAPRPANGSHSSDENEVSTTNKDIDAARLALPSGAPPNPFSFTAFPMNPASLLPQVPAPAPDLAEHLLKLGLPAAPHPHPPPTAAPPAPVNGKPNLPAAYTSVLSAMLGHNPYQPVFPGMPAPPPPSAAPNLFPTSTSTPNKEKKAGRHIAAIAW